MKNLSKVITEGAIVTGVCSFIVYITGYVQLVGYFDYFGIASTYLNFSFLEFATRGFMSNLTFFIAVPFTLISLYYSITMELPSERMLVELKEQARRLRNESTSSESYQKILSTEDKIDETLTKYKEKKETWLLDALKDKRVKTLVIAFTLVYLFIICCCCYFNNFSAAVAWAKSLLDIWIFLFFTKIILTHKRAFDPWFLVLTLIPLALMTLFLSSAAYGELQGWSALKDNGLTKIHLYYDNDDEESFLILYAKDNYFLRNNGRTTVIPTSLVQKAEISF